MLTALNPLVTHTNRTQRVLKTLHSTPENNMYCGNSHCTNHTYQGTYNRRHNYHTALVRLSHTDHEQEGFHHIGSPRWRNWFHSTYWHEYSYDIFYTCETTASNLENSATCQGTVYEGNLLSSIMMEQTIIQAALVIEDIPLWCHQVPCRCPSSASELV